MQINNLQDITAGLTATPEGDAFVLQIGLMLAAVIILLPLIAMRDKAEDALARWIETTFGSRRR